MITFEVLTTLSEQESNKFHRLEIKEPFSCMRIQEFEEIELNEVYGLLKGLVMKDIHVISAEEQGQSYAGQPGISPGTLGRGV